MPSANSEIKKDSRLFILRRGNVVWVTINPIQLQTELGFSIVCAVKNILICNPAPYEQSNLFATSRFQDGGFYWEMGGEKTTSWGDKPSSRGRLSYIYKSKIGWHVAVEPEPMIPRNMSQEMFCLGCPAIMPFSGKYPPSIVANRIKIGFPSKPPLSIDEGAFKFCEGFSSRIRCYSGRFRKTDSENPQNKCENCNYKGRNSDYFLVENVHKISGPMQADYNRSVMGGAVIMFGIIGLLLFAILFWWLIT